MKMKVAGLAFMIIAGVFVFTRTRDVPPSDLRDAVGDNFDDLQRVKASATKEAEVGSPGTDHRLDFYRTLPDVRKLADPVASLLKGSDADKAGLDEAADLCGKISLADTQRECFSITRAAKYFSPAAVDICGHRTYDSDKVTCLRSIANQTITDPEAKICGKMVHDSDRMKCLKASGRPWEDSRSGFPGQGAGLNDADSICKSQYYDNDKLKCRQFVGGVKHFSPLAVDVCSRLRYKHAQVKCLKIISNQMITDPEARACGGTRVTADMDKIDCLKAINRPYPNSTRYDENADPDLLGQGTSDPGNICEKMVYAVNTRQCHQFVAGVEYFSPAAVDVCSRLLGEYEPFECLGIIANKKIPDSEAKLCGKLPSAANGSQVDTDSAKMACLRAIK